MGLLCGGEIKDYLPDEYTVKHVLKPEVEAPNGQIRYIWLRWSGGKSSYQKNEDRIWSDYITQLLAVLRQNL